MSWIVHYEFTPNPNSMYVVTTKIVAKGIFSFDTVSEQCTLATQLLQTSFIEHLLLSGYKITLNKFPRYEWDHILCVLLRVIEDNLLSHTTLSHNVYQVQSPVVSQIQQIIQVHILPALQQHGGGMSLVKYDDLRKTLYLKLHGACINCPGAQITVYHAVANMFKIHVPEILEIKIV